MDRIESQPIVIADDRLVARPTDRLAIALGYRQCGAARIGVASHDGVLEGACIPDASVCHEDWYRRFGE